VRDVIHYECDRRAGIAAWSLGFRDGYEETWRDVFGASFSDTRIAPEWRSPTVLSLARTIYEEEQFDLMPILADALEERGCDNRAVLGHCREPRGHVRGCWVVDCVLGKE
jgi:hypothetical protein